MTKNDILTRDEIDAMWQQALCKAVADGEMYTRYQFAELLEAKVRADEREACAKVCEDIEEAYQRQERMRHPILRTDAETGSGECADAIRARGKK